MENLELRLLIIPLVSSNFSCTLTLFLYVSILQVFIIGKKKVYILYDSLFCFQGASRRSRSRSRSVSPSLRARSRSRSLSPTRRARSRSPSPRRIASPYSSGRL